GPRRLGVGRAADPLREALLLRDLRVSVVDGWPVVARRVEAVVAPDDARARLPRPPQRLLLIVDDEADVVGPVAPARAFRQRDELIADVDERHAAAAAAKLDLVEDALEEPELLVDVLDLDGDVV